MGSAALLGCAVPVGCAKKSTLIAAVSLALSLVFDCEPQSISFSFEKKNRLPSLTPAGRAGCPPTPRARLMPTARRNGAAPNRAVSQEAGLADGEASDDMPLRAVRAGP